MHCCEYGFTRQILSCAKYGHTHTTFTFATFSESHHFTQRRLITTTPRTQQHFTSPALASQHSSLTSTSQSAQQPHQHQRASTAASAVNNDFYYVKFSHHTRPADWRKKTAVVWRGVGVMEPTSGQRMVCIAMPMPDWLSMHARKCSAKVKNTPVLFPWWIGFLFCHPTFLWKIWLQTTVAL